MARDLIERTVRLDAADLDVPRGNVETGGNPSGLALLENSPDDSVEDGDTEFRIVGGPGESASLIERRVRFCEQLRRSGRVSELPLERRGRSLDEGAQEV